MTPGFALCYRERVRLLALALVCLWSAALPAPQAPNNLWGTRLDGSPLTQLAPAGTRAVVLFFVATDCPVSNRTFPEMRRLRQTFSGRNLRFWFVYPNTTETPGEIRSHQTTFDPGSDVNRSALQDPTGALVRLTHAVATPEIAILIPDAPGWHTVYTGRLDNRYVRLGLERPAATEHFGEDALTAILAGHPPHPPAGQPVGCAIVNPGVQ